MIHKSPRKLHHAALERQPEVRVGLDAIPIQCEPPSIIAGLGKGLVTGALVGGLALRPWMEGAFIGAGVGGVSQMLSAIFWR